MIIALLWLTVSTPFVADCQKKTGQQEKKSTSNSPLSGSEEDAANPFAGTTEEKTPGSITTLNEYLHETEELQHPSILIAEHNNSHTATTYTAFHGEPVGPPPKA